MSTYTDDPRWQAAQERLLSPAGDTPTQRLTDSIRAAVEMHEVETRVLATATEVAS